MSQTISKFSRWD